MCLKLMETCEVLAFLSGTSVFEILRLLNMNLFLTCDEKCFGKVLDSSCFTMCFLCMFMKEALGTYLEP